MSDFAALRSRLERAGLDTTSAEWLLKALSPAAPSGAGCQIPDTSATATANPEFINTYTISAPSGVVGTWDCLVIKSPTYPCLGYAVAAPSGFDFTSSWHAAGATVTVLQTEPATAAVSDAQSATSWNITTGVVTGGVLLQSLLPSTQPLAWRTTARSSTEYLVASDLNNQGTVTTGQYVTRIQPYNPGSVWGIPPTAAVYNLSIMEIPLNETNMTAMNPKVRVAPAKQGCYQPLYNAGPSFAWARGADFPQIAQDITFDTNKTMFLPIRGASANPFAAACVPTILMPLDPTAGVANSDWVSFGGNALMAYPAVAGNPYTWGYDNGMVGISLYRGISVTASITLKLITALELVPAPTSPIRQFVVPAANNDPRALQLYYDLVHDMPHTYPASSNFLSAVLGAVASLLPQVLPHIPGVISAVRGLFSGPAAPTPPRGEAQPEMAASNRSRPAATPRKRTPKLRPAIKPRSSSAGSRASSRSGKRVQIKARKGGRR